MKTLLLITIMVFLMVEVSAQTSLTYLNNALVAGDSYTFREIQCPDPGNAGSKQIWDFSDIQYTGKTQVSNLQSATAQKLSGAGDFNLLINENGYDYFMKTYLGGMDECGYENTSLKLTMAYSDPVVKMRYPFSFGDQFSDHFIGIAWYSETSKIDFFGDHLVNADAYGTLILPDGIIENTLRVKSVKKGLQVNMCGMTDINIVKYSWYAAGYRYPVLSLTIAQTQASGATPQITKTAFTNTRQYQTKSTPVAGTNVSVKLADPAKEIAKPEVKVSLSPNPFTDKLTYNYYLSEPMAVSVELFSITGKNNGWLVKNQTQRIGLHTGELDAVIYGLSQGVHFLRFAFDKQVVILKIVKI